MSDPNFRRRLLQDAVRDNIQTTEQRAAEQAAAAAATPGARRDSAAHRGRGSRGVVVAVALAGLIVAAVAMVLLSRESTPSTEGAATGVADNAGTETPFARPAKRAPADAVAPVFAEPRKLPAGVLPLAVNHVVIDPGHGGDDRGTATGDQAGALAEKDITLDIATRLEPMLREAGFDVTLTRRSDRTLTLRERAELANRLSADLFVSIHVNWFGARSVRGVETYYLGTTDDPELNAFARRENRDSGYTLADTRSLLEGIYADVRQDESRRLAAQIQRALHRSLLPTTPELRDRGVKTAPFVVLVATEMPAILAEVSCLSNQEEAERLARPRYREHLATALLNGIQAYAHEVNQTEEQGS